MTLVLSSKPLEKSTKKPPAGVAEKGTPGQEGYVAKVNGATLITFAPINPRPKDTKLAIRYDLYPGSFTNPGQWCLVAKGADKPDEAVLALLQIGVVGEEKKKPDGNGWGTFIPGEGIRVQDPGENDKPQKTAYLVRTAPVVGTENTPASKGYSVKASSLIKPPKLKADYKKEVVKVKAGIDIQGPKAGGATGVTSYTAENAKDGYDIKPVLSDRGVGIKARIRATAKKPASTVQSIVLAPRARMDDLKLEPNKGKVKLPKGYEVLKDSETGKYGTMPKITGAAAAGISGVRLKSTAKATKDGSYTGEAASADGAIFYDWDVIDPAAKKPKEGVTAAEIIGPDYRDGRLVNLYFVESSGIDKDGALTVKLAVKGVPGTVVSENTLKNYFKGVINGERIGKIANTEPVNAKGLKNLPSITVSFSYPTTSGAAPGTLVVDAYDSSTVGTQILEIAPLSVAVDWTDAAKVDVAKTQVGTITFSAAEVTAAEDADAAKALVETKLKALTDIPSGVDFTITISGTAPDFSAAVVIECGTGESKATETVTLPIQAV